LAFTYCLTCLHPYKWSVWPWLCSYMLFECQNVVPALDWNFGKFC
jgi:hypothetical protein